MVAKQYGLESCAHKFREYARHESAESPGKAHEYRTCLLKTPPYAIYSSQDSAGFQFIGIKDWGDVLMTSFLAFINKFPQEIPDKGGLFTPNRFDSDDTILRGQECTLPCSNMPRDSG